MTDARPTLAQLLRPGPTPGAVALKTHATDGGEATEGARIAPAEIRRRLLNLPSEAGRRPREFFDLGDDEGPIDRRSHPVLCLGGGMNALTADVTAAHAPLTNPLIIRVAGVGGPTTDFAGATCIHFGARDLAPADDVISLDECLDSGVPLLELATRRVPTPRPRPAIIAIHLSAFTLPGVAAPSALGLEPNAFWPVVRAWTKRLDVRLFGLYGLIPPLDTRGVTADFAARLARQFLHV